MIVDIGLWKMNQFYFQHMLCCYLVKVNRTYLELSAHLFLLLMKYLCIYLVYFSAYI